MQVGNLADGDLNADVVPAQSNVFLQLQRLVEVRHLTERVQERLGEEEWRGQCKCQSRWNWGNLN